MIGRHWRCDLTQDYKNIMCDVLFLLAAVSNIMFNRVLLGIHIYNVVRDCTLLNISGTQFLRGMHCSSIIRLSSKGIKVKLIATVTFLCQGVVGFWMV